MVVGDPDYQLNISRIAAAFRGGVDMEYLQNAPASRIRELSKHSRKIAEELRGDG